MDLQAYPLNSYAADSHLPSLPFLAVFRYSESGFGRFLVHQNDLSLWGCQLLDSQVDRQWIFANQADHFVKRARHGMLFFGKVSAIYFYGQNRIGETYDR